MNCFEFKKLALSDPYSEGHGFLEHRQECDDCASRIANITSMDNNIRQAFSVKMPDDMKARLKLRQVIEKEQHKHKNFRHFTYAASTLLAVGLAFLTYQNHQLTQVNERYLALHDASIKHITYEELSLTSVQDTAQTRMKAHLASLAGIEADNLPGLRYSQLCPVLGKKTWHAVMETGDGEIVTIIFFNGENVKGKSLKRDGWNSQVVDGKLGDVILIGKSKKSLNAAKDQLQSSISI